MQTKKIITKFLLALALTFLIPQLVILYIWEDLSTRTSFLLLLSTLALIGIGSYIIWDIVKSIRGIFKDLGEMSPGAQQETVSGSKDELQVMESSIEVLSKKIVEDMEALQYSAELVEKTKSELNEALLHAENIMDSMGDALIVVGPALKVKRVNQSAKKLLGYREEDLLGRSIDVLFKEIFLSDFSTDALIADKRMCFITREKQEIPVDVSIRPLNDPKGGHRGHVVVARDMRMTLKLVSRLKAANRSLEESLKKRTADIEKIYTDLKAKDTQILQQEKMASLGMLATGIAHEINNPVGYINSNLEMLQDDLERIISYMHLLEQGLSAIAGEPNQDRREQEVAQFKEICSKMEIDRHARESAEIVQESRQGLDRIKQIIHDLKRFSHTGESQEESVDLNQEIQSTLNIVGHELKYKAKIVKDFGCLPLFTCYPHQLNQVFMNLLVNASQAIEERGTITIRTFTQEGSLFITIQDDGPGIPPANLKQIFEPFFTTKAPGKGSGLGLYLSRGLVEKSGGRLSVESTPGEGSTFTIELPLAKAGNGVFEADLMMTLPAPSPSGAAK